MTIIDWDTVFSKLEEKIANEDFFTWTTYKNNVTITIGAYETQLPKSFKEAFVKKYNVNPEWVHEAWKNKEGYESMSYRKFSIILEKCAFQYYKYMTQRQKQLFRERLEESEENYTILNDNVAFAPE